MAILGQVLINQQGFLDVPYTKGILSLSLNEYKDYVVHADGSITIDVDGISDGDAGMIEIIVDNTGGYTIELGTSFTKQAGAGTIDNTADADNLISYRVIGTNVIFSIVQLTTIGNQR